jgi:hypothetical protein
MVVGRVAVQETIRATEVKVVTLAMVAGRVVVAMAEEEILIWEEILVWEETPASEETLVWETIQAWVEDQDDAKVVDMEAKLVGMAAKDAATTTTTSSMSRGLLASSYGRS